MELLRDDGHHDQVGYDVVKMILDFCKEAKSVPEIMGKFAFSNRLYLKRHFLDKMLMNKKLKMTLPDKPSSRNQKYYILFIILFKVNKI